MAVAPETLFHPLTVLDGGRARIQAIEEAHIEAVAFMDECVTAAALIVDAIAGLPIPSLRAIETANRLAHRASLAKAELLDLGPRGAA